MTKQCLIQLREWTALSAACERHIRRTMDRAAREGDRTVLRDRELTAGVGSIERSAAHAFSYRLDAPVQGEPRDARGSSIIVLYIEAAPICRPLRVVDR